MNIQSSSNSSFSLATLLYARMRKVSSRVIDVTYFMQDRKYAQHIMNIALETKDAELASFVERLKDELGFQDDEEQVDSKKSKKQANQSRQESYSLLELLQNSKNNPF